MGRPNKVIKLNCCMIVVQRMFYGSFGTPNSMVTPISKFDPRKCQCQVKLGQIRTHLQIQNLLKNMPILFSFVSGIQK